MNEAGLLALWVTLYALFIISMIFRDWMDMRRLVCNQMLFTIRL